MKNNYHTHTTYCDGKEEMKIMVERAIQLGFNHLGFSSHAPIEKENNFSIQKEMIPEYISEIEYHQLQNSKIQLFKGLECDFIPHLTKPFSVFKELYKLDFVIGGIHLVHSGSENQLWFIDGSKQQIYDDGLKNLFQNNIKKAVTTFWEQTYEMIESQKFDIIAHMDKIKMHNRGRFFSEEDVWYKDLVRKAIDLVYNKNLIVEINSRGLYKKRCDSFYPSDFILQIIAKKGIPMIISSDAHKAEELDLFYKEAVNKLKQIGIQNLVYLSDNGWKEIGI
jgi:histidinol-phosphatase (PHP family)